jgi:Ca2+-binding RTX toxin-like protein
LEANKIYGQAIFGDAIIKPQKPIVITDPLEFSSGGFPPFDEDVYVQHVQQPAIVIDNAADDTIDARQGIKKVNNAVHASRKQGDAVFWATGDGNDVITGVSDRSNIFEIGKGNKKMTGGAGNDTFRINPAEMNASMFDGGEGKDMLDMSFVAPNNQAPIEVVLSQLVVHWEEGPGFIESMGSKSILKSIENVTTSKTARTAVTGNKEDNVFVLNGNGDSAVGVYGNDTYVVNGAGTVKIEAGSGENRYKIARSIETV